MEIPKVRWIVEYYVTVDGKSVVEEEMKAFGTREFARILRTVNLLEEFGVQLGGEYVAPIEGKIWELRVSRYRVLYFTPRGKRFVLLSAFMKKTKRTPKREIATAERRLQDYVRRAKEGGARNTER